MRRRYEEEPLPEMSLKEALTIIDEERLRKRRLQMAESIVSRHEWVALELEHHRNLARKYKFKTKRSDGKTWVVHSDYIAINGGEEYLRNLERITAHQKKMAKAKIHVLK